MLELSNMQHFCFCLYSSRMNKFLNNSINTVDYRLSTHFFWYAPRLKYAPIQKDKKKILNLLYNFYKIFIYFYQI